MSLVSDRKFGVHASIVFNRKEIDSVRKDDWEILCDRIHKNESFDADEKTLVSGLSNLLLDIEMLYDDSDFDADTDETSSCRKKNSKAYDDMATASYDMSAFDGPKINEVLDWVASLENDDRLNPNEKKTAHEMFDFLEDSLWTRASMAFETVWGDAGDRVFSLFLDALASGAVLRPNLATKEVPDIRVLAELFNKFCTLTTGTPWNAENDAACTMVESALKLQISEKNKEVETKDAFDGLDFDAPFGMSL